MSDSFSCVSSEAHAKRTDLCSSVRVTLESGHASNEQVQRLAKPVRCNALLDSCSLRGRWDADRICEPPTRPDANASDLTGGARPVRMRSEAVAFYCLSE